MSRWCHVTLHSQRTDVLLHISMFLFISVYTSTLLLCIQDTVCDGKKMNRTIPQTLSYSGLDQYSSSHISSG